MPERSNWSDRVGLQLERLLCSAEFNKSERLRKFLTYVVEETLAGAETIRSYNIAVEVFQKGEGFDPGDPYVRNIGRHTRKALNKYYETAGRDDDIRIDVPAGNYIASFEQRAATEKCADKVYEVADKSPHYLSVVAANEPASNAPALMPLRPADSTNPTVAVIPFRYYGSTLDDESVIGEILAGRSIAGLSRTPNFNVISRLSTTRLRNVDWTLEKIFEQLGSNYVMSGSYRCSDGKLLLSAELADCVSAEVIWADELVCSVADLLHEQDTLIDELISQTARAVVVHEIKRAAFEPLQSLSLHTNLVVGVHDMHSNSEQRFYHARERFEQILCSHPQHATVNARIAHWLVLKLNRKGGWNHSVEETKTEASRYLKKALKAGPSNPLALTIKGLIETQFNRNPEQGLDIYNYALQFHPNDPLLYAYKAAVLSYKGEGEMAVQCARKALQLSPFDPQLNMFHTCAAAAYYSVNDFDNAEKHAIRADALNPRHTSNLRTLVAIQVDLGKIKEAQESARRLLRNDPQFTTSSYLARSPNAGYHSGRIIAERLEQAGVPCK